MLITNETTGSEKNLAKGAQEPAPLAARRAKKRDTIETEKYSKENALDLKGSATRRAEFVCFVLFFFGHCFKKSVFPMLSTDRASLFLFGARSWLHL